MNQRLKELAAEAYRAVDPGPDTYNEAEAAWVWFGALERKFAELIVQECARVAAATPFPDADEDIRKTFGHTWDMACADAGKQVRNLLK